MHPFDYRLNYLPTFQVGLGMNFIDAYLIISWLCRVPDFLVAEWIVWRRKNL